MRRLATSFFMLCAALSLLICIGAILLWLATHFHGYEERGRDLIVRAHSGVLEVTRVYATGPPMIDEDWLANPGGLIAYRNLPRRVWAVGPLRFERGQERRIERADFGHPRPISYGSVSVPFWCVALMSSLLPVVASRRLLLQRRRQWRGRHNRCLTCGYDLRASLGFCPECGKPPHNPPMQRTATAGAGAVELNGRGRRVGR